jgi:hypothetical protein
MALLLEKSIHIYQIKKKDDFYQLEYEIFFLEKKITAIQLSSLLCTHDNESMLY